MNTSEQNFPLVTVVVAAYNEDKFIGRCIRSLLSQHFPNELFEIMVVNDGSNDRTDYALELFEEDLTIINNDENIGLPASLNKAIRKVRTPYFVRVDADDFVGNNFILFLYSFITENPYMDAVACDYNVINNKELVISRNNCMESPIACGIMFKTEQIIEIGLYDEDFLLHEERDLRIRFLKKYNIYRLELPLYRYRKHENNITGNKKEMDHYMSSLLKKHNIDKAK
jgi:glycosyltransferase involved in cell wall biosynthesis